MTYTEHLCPITEHPELSHLDDAGLHLWADAHGLTVHRDWRGLLCTTLDDAYKLREILDEEAVRQAIAEQAERDRIAAEDELRLAPIRRKLEAHQRRQDALTAIADIPFDDERLRDWEARADERGEALFEKIEPAPEVDTRTPLERLMAKRESR